MENINNPVRPAFAKAANDNIGPSHLSKAGLRRALNPPHDRTQEILHGITVHDPFRPLEKLDAPETAAWAERENKKFSDYIADAEETKQAAVAFLTDAMDDDTYTAPQWFGDKCFRSHKEALAAQRRIEVSDSSGGPWKTLVDPNTLSADGTVSVSGWQPSGDGKRLIYFLSNSGSDMETIYVLDVETGRNLAGIGNSRSTSVLWDKGSHDGFQYSYGNGAVYHHTMGQPVPEDRLVFSPPVGWARPFRLNCATYEWMYQLSGTDQNFGLLFRPFGSDMAFMEIIRPKEFSLKPIEELEDGTVLAITNKDAPRGRLVSFNPYDPAPEKWKTVIPEQKEDALNSIVRYWGKIFAFYKHDAADAVKVFTPGGKHLHDIDMPPQSLASIARYDGNKLSLKISSFKNKGDFYSYDIASNELTFEEKGPGKYNLDDAIIERVYATSKDGTKVPMTVIRGPDTKLDGTAAVKLHGYGGFNVPMNPVYSDTIMHFVKSGGIYVQANLRGGGEFGEDWYNQGRLKNKQNVFDDFIASAEHLIKNKYTSPERLVIEGGSNGGLLTATTLEQRPDLLGAVVTHVPVTDMFRLNGWWQSDYGEPKSIREDFNAAARYSPVHNVKRRAKYPPHLILTGDHDNRVLPWHSFKLAATLQAESSPKNVTLLRIEPNAGHGAGKSTAQIIQEQADIFTFIEKAIGPVNQQAYKAMLAQQKRKIRRPLARKHKRR